SNNYWRWFGNTNIAVTTITKLSGGDPIAPTVVTLADLEENPEMWESVLVKVENSHIGAFNQYDLTITDGTNSYLLDDDCVPDSVFTISSYSHAVYNNSDTLQVGRYFDSITGISIFSYGTHKIEIRSGNDLDIAPVSVADPVVELPEAFKLYPAYPNPFNPVTFIRFDLPEFADVKVIVYNMRGQLVKTLVNEHLGPGQHLRVWDGTNNMNESVSSGLYIARIKAGNAMAVQKMTFLK
ncbi:MAG TPA: T9SS type A sorting domain-containing protein, partial [Candidatus Marinimicrobia bacterium]|nr:T9SS type A sorting domain-containing protein [Candidatus Neomarinimicrobiota bacterium]